MEILIFITGTIILIILINILFNIIKEGFGETKNTKSNDKLVEELIKLNLKNKNKLNSLLKKAKRIYKKYDELKGTTTAATKLDAQNKQNSQYDSVSSLSAIENNSDPFNFKQCGSIYNDGNMIKWPVNKDEERDEEKDEEKETEKEKYKGWSVTNDANLYSIKEQVNIKEKTTWGPVLMQNLDETKDGILYNFKIMEKIEVIRFKIMKVGDDITKLGIVEGLVDTITGKASSVKKKTTDSVEDTKSMATDSVKDTKSMATDSVKDTKSMAKDTTSNIKKKAGVDKKTDPNKKLSKEDVKLKSEIEGKVQGYNAFMFILLEISKIQTKYINDMNDITKFYNKVYKCLRQKNSEKNNKYENTKNTRSDQSDNAKQQLNTIGNLFE
jgi:hypothetical protein